MRLRRCQASPDDPRSSDNAAAVSTPAAHRHSHGFTSQLLCEQVVGRGLRRSSHDDLSVPEFVDVYGVPFQMLPFARGGTGGITPPPRHDIRGRPT